MLFILAKNFVKNCLSSRPDFLALPLFNGLRGPCFRNSVVITMDMFDLIDIQGMKHPNVNKYSYESKPLKMKSRIDHGVNNCYCHILPATKTFFLKKIGTH